MIAVYTLFLAIFIAFVLHFSLELTGVRNLEGDAKEFALRKISKFIMVGEFLAYILGFGGIMFTFITLGMIVSVRFPN